MNIGNKRLSIKILMQIFDNGSFIDWSIELTFYYFYMHFENTSCRP